MTYIRTITAAVWIIVFLAVEIRVPELAIFAATAAAYLVRQTEGGLV